MSFELIGLAGTAFIVLAFTFSDQIKIRVFDGIGAALFIVYGFMIHSWSNIILNGILIAIHIYKIAKMLPRRKAVERRGE